MLFLAGNLGCQAGALPKTYLGIPLGNKNYSIEIWNVVIERCDKTVKMEITVPLRMWELILIHSVLDALRTYIMFIFPIAQRGQKRIDRLRSLLQKWHGHLGEISYPRNMGMLNQWTTHEVNNLYDNSVWRTIKNQWQDYRKMLILLWEMEEKLIIGNLWNGQTEQSKVYASSSLLYKPSTT